jgi:ribosomal RNA-processing protein 12
VLCLQISISTGLDVLATGVHKRLTEAAELVEELEFADFRADADVLKGLSEKLLPTLFKLVDDLFCSQNGDTSLAPKEPRSDSDALNSQASALTCAITSLAKLAPPNLLQSLFTKVIHRLLEASQAEEDLSDKMCSLLALAQALYTSQCLSESSVVLLYRALRPLIATDETQPRTQKRAYKALAELCKSKTFVTSDGRTKELVELLTASTATSQISARSMRLRCLEAITDSLRGSPAIEQWIYSSLLPEILLCLKDSNKRTRESASNLLMSVSKDGADTVILIQCITAAVASETSHMRSAAVTALSKVVHEHGRTDQRVQDLIPSLLQTVLLLSDDPSREVAKSFLVFVRVAVKACPPEMTKDLLPAILESLLKYHKGKDRFRGKIKMLMKKLVRTYGYDYLLPLIPESQNQIIAYVKKLPKLDAKAKDARRGRPQAREKSVDEMMASDEEDSDDEAGAFGGSSDRKATTGKRGRGARTGDLAMGQTLIRNDSSGSKLEVKDLANKVGRSGGEFEDSDDDDDEVKFDDRGKLVVTEDGNEKKTDANDEPMIDAARRPSARDRAAGQDPRRQKEKGKKLGDSYKARKAGGDVKRKGQKLDPYAYVPLDGRSYTKKNRRNAVEQLDSVVRGKKRQKR